MSSLRDKILKFICGHISEISKGKELFRLQGYQIQLLLASNFTVDCSEIEILRVVLEWIEKSGERGRIDVSKILTNINFKEITVHDVKKILKTLNIKRNDELYNIVWSFVVPQSLQIENEYKLLNNRGMSLALVKIGGFELTGLTNEITYAFTSSRNPQSIIEGPWRSLTEVPHVKELFFSYPTMRKVVVNRIFHIFLYSGKARSIWNLSFKQLHLCDRRQL